MAKTVSLIVNEQFVSASVDAAGAVRTHQVVPVETVLEQGVPAAALPAGEHALLLVPDYWLAIKTFPIATAKPSLVIPFIRKKLQLELGDQPGGEDYFDYLHYQDDDGERGVTVFYPQEPQLPRLHQHLAAIGRAPLAITTPGLLWEARLRETRPDFGEGGKLLICLLGSECFFLFFYQGRFLFSRDFSVFKDAPSTDRLEALAYEVQQSRFLFAQKARGEIDQVLLAAVATTAVDPEALAARIGRAVTLLSQTENATVSLDEATLSPLLFFTQRDWGRKARFINLAHRQVRQAREWWPAQSIALACGIAMVVLLGSQALYQGSRSSLEQARQRSARMREQSEQVRALSGNLDEILKRRRVPVASDALVRMAQCLPGNVDFDTFDCDLVQERQLLFEGTVRANGPEAFKQTLLELIGRVRERFPGNDQLSYREIQFSTKRRVPGEPLSEFHITFKVRL